MTAYRIVPLVLAAALLNGGVASAQPRQMGRPGTPPVIRPVPPVVVLPKQVVKPKPFVAPHVVAKPIFAPPVSPYYHRNHVPPSYVYHRPAYTPSFWGGLWGGYPTYLVTYVPVFVYPLPGFCFGW